MEGKVKWFSNAKGYGFIGREGGPDVFVHYSGIVANGYRTLQEAKRGDCKGSGLRSRLCKGRRDRKQQM